VLDAVDILSWLDDTEPVSSVGPVRSARADTLISSQASGTCFEIKREVLLSVLEKAINVVPTRDLVPVLTNFKIKAEPGKLSVVASSTSMSIVVETSQVDVKEAGEDFFPARTFMSVVKEAAAGSTIYVEVTVHGLVVVANAYTAEIALAPGKGFPKQESLEGCTFYDIDKQSFVAAINTVKYALPNREFSGMDTLRMISIKGGKFTACDGARFQQVRIPGFKLNMQLPSDSISYLLKFMAASDLESVEVAELTHKLIFRLGNVVFYLNKLEAPYPNVEQLWLRPALANDQELLVDRQELITAIKQVKVTDISSYAVGLVIDEDKMTIVTKDGDNSSKTTIACKWSGKPRTIVVNYLQLAEMLKSYPQKECRFLLGEDSKTHKSPILLKDNETMALATISQMLAYRAGLTG
jgi:DNA polymerase III sliding clamp (beta) subunit (PCNA family)